jgi:chemotaxis protein histidine kinase CheA
MQKHEPRFFYSLDAATSWQEWCINVSCKYLDDLMNHLEHVVTNKNDLSRLEVRFDELLGLIIKAITHEYR